MNYRTWSIALVMASILTSLIPCRMAVEFPLAHVTNEPTLFYPQETTGLFELAVHRSIVSQRCHVESLRPIQRQRGTRVGTSTWVERYERVSSTGGDAILLTFYGVDIGSLHAMANEECQESLDLTEFRTLFEDDWEYPIPMEVPQMPLSTANNEHDAMFRPPRLTIYPLVSTGNASNRVDLVFFGDGYTMEEETKFLDDATRLAMDITRNQTFARVRPLLNIWAAFTPSDESGISTPARPINTTFGLYREGTELRAVYAKHKRVARAACRSLGSRCDYPILLANSEFYGGLGGEFTITTSSVLNGALVLRHELGHSIINVGEEYDGGYAYFGANAARLGPNGTPSSHLKWSHWLDQKHVAPIRLERSVSPLQQYPWTILNTSSPFSTAFHSSGDYQKYMLRFSLSGAPHATDLQVLLDGVDQKWQPRENVGVDRWHYDLLVEDQGLAVGKHEIQFVKTKEAEKEEYETQLCSVEVIEYGGDDEFDMTPGHIGAYPTFSMWNTTTLRPTNEECLMRRVVFPNFCKPCLESLWLHLFKHVSPVDSLAISVVSNHASSSLLWKVGLNLVQVADLRSEVEMLHVNEERFEIEWTRNGARVREFDDQQEMVLGWERGLGMWEILVTFHTKEVRKDPLDLLRARVSFVLGADAQTHQLPHVSNVVIE